MPMQADHYSSQAEPSAKTALTSSAQTKNQAEQKGDAERKASCRAELPEDGPRCEKRRAEPCHSQADHIRGQSEQVRDVPDKRMQDQADQTQAEHIHSQADSSINSDPEFALQSTTIPVGLLRSVELHAHIISASTLTPSLPGT